MIFYGLTLCIPLLIILVDIILVLAWVVRNDHKNQSKISAARVSILLAVRNEEANLRRCLDAILALDYPVNKLEVLIGDDFSTDRTGDILEAYAARWSHIKRMPIEDKPGVRPGKANVLAQLAQNASGDYFFFTDADVAIPGNWVENLLACFSEKTGIVSGLTAVSGADIWSKVQFLDWLFALGKAKILSDFGYTITALGNNMAVSREAYFAVGGYEGIPFSVTEDYELLKQIRKKGYKSHQIFNSRSIAWTLPETSLSRLLNQRKRWMKGAVQLPWFGVFVLGLQVLFFPCIVVLCFINLETALYLFLTKLLLQTTMGLLFTAGWKQKKKLNGLLLYELYSAALSLSLMIFYFLPRRISWKGRKY